MAQCQVRCSEYVFNIKQIKFIYIIAKEGDHIVAKSIEKDMAIDVLWTPGNELICVKHCS
jgi:hypothetical protein